MGAQQRSQSLEIWSEWPGGQSRGGPRLRGPLTALALLKMEIETGVCSGLLSASRFAGLIEV